MNRKDFTLIANMISSKVGVRFCKSWFSSTWRADVDKKVIYYPDNILYDEADLGALIHEAGHIRFSTMPLNSQKLEEMSRSFNKPGQQIWDLLNVIEDIRVEKLMKGIYPGAKKYIDTLRTTDNMQHQIAMSQLKRLHPKRFNELKNRNWNHYLSCVLDSKALDDQKQFQMYKDLWDIDKNQKVTDALKKTDDAVNRAISTKTTEESFEIIQKEILPHYLPLCDDIPPMTDEQMKKMIESLMKAISQIVEDLKKEQEAKGKGKGKGQKKDKQDGDKSDEESDEDGNGKGDGDDGDEQDFDEFDDADAEEIQTERENAKKRMGIVKVSGHKPGKDLPKREKKILTSEEDLREEVQNSIGSVRKAISIIKDTNVVRFEGNYETGKLQTRKVYKIFTGQTKIFSKKVVTNNDDKDFVFYIAVDISGSMDEGCRTNRRKSDEACAAVATLGKALEMAGKRFEVLAFHTDSFVVKPFDKKMNYEDMLTISRGRGGTNDVRAINKSAEVLKNQPEKNKVLIVITDGDVYLHETKVAVDAAEKFAKVYGIGIGGVGLKQAFKRAINIDDASELGVEFGKILKEYVGRRTR